MNKPDPIAQHFPHLVKFRKKLNYEQRLALTEWFKNNHMQTSKTFGVNARVHILDSWTTYAFKTAEDKMLFQMAWSELV